MKLVTWNCSGAFRTKCNVIENEYQPDILVVQECEDPARSTRAYRDWSGDYLWHGKNKNRGIGVFDRAGVGLKRLRWSDDELESFLPCQLGNGVKILGVWTKHANSPNFRYIGQFWKYLQKHREKLASAESAVIAGDFNSNACWDEWDRWWNHSDVVRELSEIGIESFYHRYFGEAQGEETRPTLYHLRRREKAYHVDYIFGSIGLISNDSLAVSVGLVDEWLEHSDHMPLIAQIACLQCAAPAA